MRKHNMDNNKSQEFEAKWHGKIIRPKGKHYRIPIKRYLVTVALYKYEDNVTIFGIMAEDYKFGKDSNGHFFTVKIGPEELEECMNDFEIIEAEGGVISIERWKDIILAKKAREAGKIARNKTDEVRRAEEAVRTTDRAAYLKDVVEAEHNAQNEFANERFKG